LSKTKWYSKVFYLAIAVALAAGGVVSSGVTSNDNTASAAAWAGEEWGQDWAPEVNGPAWLIAPNSEIYDFAASPDGETIYAVGMGFVEHRIYGDEVFYETPEARLWKSEDGGVTWDDITDELDDTGFDSTDGDVLSYVAVAPDDIDFVVVAGLDSEMNPFVYGSNEGGEDFGDTNFSSYAPWDWILCLDVAPEVDDVYNIAVGTDVGNIWRFEAGGYWSGSWKLVGGYDAGVAVYAGWDNSDVDGLNPTITTAAVTSIAFSPNFVADATVLAVTVDDGDTLATYLQSSRWGNVKKWNDLAGTSYPEAVEIVDAPSLWDWDYYLVADSTGIALPSDYDGRKSDYRYAWVYVDYHDATLDEDVGRVFQIHAGSVDYAGIPCDSTKFSPELASISAYGTAEDGMVMVGLMGDYDTGEPTTGCEGVKVYYTSLPIDTCCPRWTKSKKSPTGQAEAVVAYTADGDKAYAVTSYDDWCDEGAFSVSEIEEVGRYWNQLSLIDTYIDYLSDFAVIPECWDYGTYYLASANIENGDCDSVWYSADWGEHYMRVWCGKLTPDDAINGDDTPEIGLLRLNLAEEQSEVFNVYLVDRGTPTVYWSDSAGLLDWAEESTCTMDAIGDLVVADASTLYAVDFEGDAVKSTDNGESWEAPVSLGLEGDDYGYTIAVHGHYVLVGSGNGCASYSDNSGEDWTMVGWGAGVLSGTYYSNEAPVQVAFDPYFDTNRIIYAAVAVLDDDGNPIQGGIYRWDIGRDWEEEWTDLDARPTLYQLSYDSGDDDTSKLSLAYYGIALDKNSNTNAENGGVLYATYTYIADTDGENDERGYPNEYYSGAARCLTPAADMCCGKADWDYLHNNLNVGDILYDAEGWMDYVPQQFCAVPSSLKICGQPIPEPGAPVYIYAIDRVLTQINEDYGYYYGYDYWWPLGALWDYEDCLARTTVEHTNPSSGTLIPSDPCECVNEKFTLKWNRPCDACLYDVEIALNEDFDELYKWEYAYEPPKSASPSLLVGGELDCSTTYYWRVRVVRSEGANGEIEIIRSFWSKPWSFSVAAGPAGAIELINPDNGATVPVDGVVFTWSSVTGAGCYEFSLTNAITGAEVASATIDAPGTSYAYTGTLDYDTSYTWQVKALKEKESLSAGNVMSESSVSTFRAAAELVPPAEVPAPTTPAWVWVIIGIGAVLVIVVIVLIFRTRRV